MQPVYYRCSECTQAFNSQLFLYKHIKSLHKNLYCEMLRTGKMSSAFQEMKVPVTGDEDGDLDRFRYFSCSECTYAFTSEVFLYKHLKRCHDGLYNQMLRSRAIASDIFQKVTFPPNYRVDAIQPRTPSLQRTKTQPGRVSSREQRGDTNQPRTPSLQRTKTFTQPGDARSQRQGGNTNQPRPPSLLQTSAQTHQKEKRFNDFDPKLTQNYHTDGTHSGKQVYDKSFKLLGDLEQYQRRQSDQVSTATYAGETTNISGKEAKTMTHPRDVRTHQHQQTFTEQKPHHTCELCRGKSFDNTNQSTRPPLAKPGKAPYICNQCNKSFNNLSILKAHQRLHKLQVKHQWPRFR